MKRFLIYGLVLIIGGGIGTLGSYFAIPEFRQELKNKIEKFKLAQIDQNAIDRGIEDQKLVRTQILKPQNIELLEEFTGTLKPNREVFLSPKLSGVLESVYYQEGQWVDAKKLLAETEIHHLNLELKLKKQELLLAQNQHQKLIKGSRQEEIDQIRFKVKELETQIENVNWNLTNTRKLYKEGVLPEKNYQDEESNLKGLKQLLEQTQSSLAMAEKGSREEDIEAARLQCQFQEIAIEAIQQKIQDAQIISPFAGYLAKSEAEVGEYVTPPKVLFHLIEMDPILLEVGVPEYLLAKIQMNQSVEVQINAFPEKTLVGKIAKIPFITSPNTRLFPIEILVENPLKQLRPGMIGKASISLKTLEEQYVFSLNYSIPQEGKKTIYLEDKGKCFRVELNDFVLYRGQILVSVSQLRSPNLITSGFLELSHGDEVKIFQPTTE